MDNVNITLDKFKSAFQPQKINKQHFITYSQILTINQPFINENSSQHIKEEEESEQKQTNLMT